MADSDYNTIPSGLTRRALLTRSAAVATGHIPSLQCFDPALSLWQQFQGLHAEAVARCRLWQQCEALVFRQADNRPAQDQIAADTMMIAAQGDPTARIASQTATAAALELLALGEQQDEAWARRDALALDLLAAPAASMAGIAAKLALIAQMGETRLGDMDFPWPQVRSALSDVLRLGGLDPHRFDIRHD